MAENDISERAEEWRDVPGYEGFYLASSLGRVKRLPRFVNSRNGSLALKGAWIFQGAPSKRTGYQGVTLIARDGHKHRTTAHHIVCTAFHGPRPSPHHQVAHGDGSRTNNRPENLRWATAKENAGDRVAHGTNIQGEDQWRTALTAADVLAIRAEYRPGYGGLTPFAKRHNITRGAVWRIVSRRNWKHI